MMKNTKYPEEAWKLITYLAGEEGQIELAKTGLAQPAIKKLAASKYFIDNEKPKNKKMLLEASEHIIFTPFTDRWLEAMERVIGPPMDYIWMNKNEKTIAEIMSDVSSKVDARIYAEK